MRGPADRREAESVGLRHEYVGRARGLAAEIETQDIAHHAAGGTAIFTSGPFDRRFRDIHAVTQQLQGRQAHFENVGQYLLGLEPDTAFL